MSGMWWSAGIDHGSRFAKLLGFEGEVPWPIDRADQKPTKKKKPKKVQVLQ